MRETEQLPCLKWPFNPLVDSTVSVIRLAVPEEARIEFEKACALSPRQSAKAQEHLRKAIELYPKYGTAWLLLAQIQLAQHKTEEGASSCQQVLDFDAEYLPPYVCLAILAAAEEKWDRVAELTNRALELHPVKAPGAYYYNSLGYFHLRQFQAAEKSALYAVENSGKDQKPEVHYLLARIFEAKADFVSEAAELREYLKLAPHGSEAVLVKNVLKQIEEQDSSSSAAVAPRAGAERK